MNGCNIANLKWHVSKLFPSLKSPNTETIVFSFYDRGLILVLLCISESQHISEQWSWISWIIHEKNKKYVHEDPIPTKIQGMSLTSSGDFGFSCHRWVKDMVIFWKSHKYNLITILLEILHCLVSLLSFEIQFQNILKHGVVHFLVTTLQYNLELSYAKSASWIA